MRGGLIFIVSVFSDVLYFGPETGSRRGGRGFKRFLGAVGFVLAKFEPKPSHEDPIRDQNNGFGTYDMRWNIEIYGNMYIYIWHKRPFVPLPAKSFNSALEEQLALIAFERVTICPSLAPIGGCQVLVYVCVHVYAYSHIIA